MSTDSRIELLETQVQKLKQVLFGALSLIIAGGLLAATAVQGVPDLIQAKEFRVVDETGSTRCQISADRIFLSSGDAEIHMASGSENPSHKRRSIRGMPRDFSDPGSTP